MRIRRALFLLVCATLAGAIAFVALQRLAPSRFRADRDSLPTRESSEASRNRFVEAQLESLRDMESRPVYPYSIVRGGVRDVKELKWAADHDPVVASHYAGFDYDHARVVRLVLARTAYLSYRIGNKVYWTRHRVSLKKGETVITDGKITARTRCGNRVEEMPQQATSESEPPIVKFDEPELPSLGTATNLPPVPYQSTLVSRNPELGPAPGIYDPIAGGTLISIFPAPLPGVCGIGTKKHPILTAGKKKKIDPCGNGGGISEVPEPGTWLLMLSGMAAIVWKFRHKLSRA